MDNDGDFSRSDAWRTPTAISVAAVIGIPVGVLLYASAVPFGPVLFGWLVALAGALIVPGGLCILATYRYFLVGFAYAAGVAGATMVADLVAPRNDPDFWGSALQFANVFIIVGLVSLLATGPCALLKWEDKRARAGKAERVRSSSNQPLHLTAAVSRYFRVQHLTSWVWLFCKTNKFARRMRGARGVQATI
jgi:hypothetical protein